LIFSGEQLRPDPIHDGLPAMRISLALLAFGTLTSWLLSGPLGRLLSNTLPSHTVEAGSTWETILKVLVNPATWMTLAIIALGFCLWAGRRFYTRIIRMLKRPAESGFGFEWINRLVVNSVQTTASVLQRTQTGQLNWNLAAILAGFMIVVLILVRGLLS
jgi:hypothetical protein